jgi:hypothetical protein
MINIIKLVLIFFHFTANALHADALWVLLVYCMDTFHICRLGECLLLERPHNAVCAPVMCRLLFCSCGNKFFYETWQINSIMICDHFYGIVEFHFISIPMQIHPANWFQGYMIVVCWLAPIAL